MGATMPVAAGASGMLQSRSLTRRSGATAMRHRGDLTLPDEEAKLACLAQWYAVLRHRLPRLAPIAPGLQGGEG